MDTQVTKTSIILRRPVDWPRWLLIIRAYADQYELWEYVDPDLPIDQLKTLEAEKPKKVPVKKFKRPEPEEEVELYELTQEEQAAYTFWKREFEREEAKWLTKKKALASLKLEVLRTIDAQLIDRVIKCSSVHENLSKLKSILCQSTPQRERQLQARYKAACKMPKRANIDS